MTQPPDQSYWSWTKSHNNSRISSEGKESPALSSMEIDTMSSTTFEGNMLGQVSKATLVTPSANAQLHQLDKKKSLFKSKINIKPIQPEGSTIDLMTLDSPLGKDGFHSLDDSQSIFRPPPKFESVWISD
jgi:hypothetical protein